MTSLTEVKLEARYQDYYTEDLLYFKNYMTMTS